MLGFEDTRPLNLVIPLKQAKAIGKHLDIHTCGELLRYYPRRYLHYGTGADLAGVKPGDTLNVIGTVVGVHIDDSVIVDGMVDVTRYQPLARLGYRDYTAVDHVFPLDRPKPQSR